MEATQPETPPEEQSAAPSPTPAADDELARLKEEAAKLRDLWLRAVAETENVRKRGQREQEDTARYAVTGFARDMVSVLENLKRASESFEAAHEKDALKPLAEGVNLTLAELLNIFERYGIKRLDPQGQKFDPNFHQAAAQVPRDDVAPGTVVQVVQAGYVIHDRLLRPAMVAVSKAPEPPKNVDTSA